jgi:hypothetical protein
VRAALRTLALGLAAVTPVHAAHAAEEPPSFEPVQADTLAPPPDSRVIEIGAPGSRPAVSDTAARRAAARDPLSGFDAPRWVMARSLVVPGWGQLHNGSWIKAIGVATGEVMLVTRVVDDNQALDDLNTVIEAARAAGDQAAEEAAVTAYNSRLDQLTRRQWLFGALLAYSLLDAYVDAHFRHFDIEFKHDPALPGGQPPVLPKKKSEGAPGEYRLALRWSF